MATKRAEFRFYAELNDFLPRQRRFATLVRLFDGEVSVKDMIEAAGVPHTEVDLVIVNRESVDFTYADAHLGRLARHLRLLGFKKRLVLRGKTFSLHLSANTHHSWPSAAPGRHQCRSWSLPIVT